MEGKPPGGLRDHIIICGLGHVGYRIAALLQSLCEPFVVIARDIRPDWRAFITENALRFVEGDARSASCLKESGIETARALFIVTSNDLSNIEIALDAQALNPKCLLIARVFDRYLADRIGREINVRAVLSPAMLTAPVFMAAALGEEMLRAFEIGGCHLNIVRVPLSAVNAPSGETLEAFCAAHELIPLTVEAKRALPPIPKENSRRRRASAACDSAPALPPSLPLADCSSALVAASEQATERLRKNGYLSSRADALASRGLSARWLFDHLTRPLFPIHAFKKTWRRAPRTLRLAFCVLLTLVFLSLVVFHATMPGSLTWVDSLYFVVSIMTTVGFGDYNLHDSPWWLKLFGCSVMIGAAGVVAISFGIITNYIITERVAEALGQRQSTLKDHIVVIGLGDVGTRVAEELHRIGEPVLAIERSADHEAVPSLQDSIHVIIGDANRESTLKRANIEQARAVIVTTTSDLDSLRIAHQAEMLNPKLRAVIRIYDSTLAHKLGAGFGIESTVNAPQVAAASFVASALQTGVEQGFMLGNRLLLLHWMTADELKQRGAVGKTSAELRAGGLTAFLRRTGNGETFQTRPVTATDVVAAGEALLVLSEYFPVSRTFGGPQVSYFTSES